MECTHRTEDAHKIINSCLHGNYDEPGLIVYETIKNSYVVKCTTTLKSQNIEGYFKLDSIDQPKLQYDDNVMDERQVTMHIELGHKETKFTRNPLES